MKPKTCWLVSFAILALISKSSFGAESPPRTLTVAAVQTANLDANYEQSRAIAERMVVEAVEKGARLILLPEFALIGYRFHDDIWKMAEPLEGPTVAWMRGLCRRYQIYLATCILEVKDDDFYDTLVLVGPGQAELWAHRKIEPALFEARYFKGAGLNPAVFETPLGRIGVAICYDTSKSHTIRNLLEGRPEIVLMTYSAPEIPIALQSMNRLNVQINLELPGLYARVLGAPAVMVNKTGKWDSPFPMLPLVPLRSEFGARSRIVAADGTVLAALEKEEAVIAAVVELGAAIPPRPQDIPPGRWFVPYSGVMRWFSDFTFHRGERRYQRSQARQKAVEQAKARHPVTPPPAGDSGNED